jgi:hypothetical protein
MNSLGDDPATNQNKDTFTIEGGAVEPGLISLGGLIAGAFWGGWWGALAGVGFGRAAEVLAGALFFPVPISTTSAVLNTVVPAGVGVLGYVKARAQKKSKAKSNRRRRLGRKR